MDHFFQLVRTVMSSWTVFLVSAAVFCRSDNLDERLVYVK